MCYNNIVRKDYGNKLLSVIDDLDSGAAPDASTISILIGSK